MTVVRTFALLDLIAKRSPDGVRVQELCDSLGIHRVTVHRLLKALIELGYVEQATNRRYHLGAGAWTLGLAASRRFDLAQAAADALTRAAEASRDTVFLMRRTATVAICVARREGSYPVRSLVMDIGSRRPLGIGASSVAILAALEPDEIEEIIRQNRTAYAERGTADPDIVRRLVADAQQRGFAFSPGAVIPEVHAIAVPVRDPAGRPVAALSIATVEPRMREPRRSELAALLADEAGRILQEKPRR